MGIIDEVVGSAGFQEPGWSRWSLARTDFNSGQEALIHGIYPTGTVDYVQTAYDMLAYYALRSGVVLRQGRTSSPPTSQWPVLALSLTSRTTLRWQRPRS